MLRYLKTVTIAGFALLLILLAGMAVYAVMQLQSSHNTLNKITSENNRKIQIATEMQVAGYRRTDYLYNMLLVDDAFSRDEKFMAFTHEGYEVGKARRLIRESGMGPEEKAIYNHQSELIELVLVVQDRVVDLATASDLEAARSLMLREAIPI
ncbi:hypothetical protein BOW53_07440 [Solemya pervernicosa gill symbiont]|uniref:Uncharacterized protein n=2 Tax=Gammaproteobacteria incertae sedis TaxID=118884 RepID=A0A1T2L601_9GAMM|nr:MCP four helix bundle domain-containing protein [Candidatus Reidiella endopervernicosa]OOZ40538.1 hypothetical protein BOW53_07440 [Solemya pervernicosa gill symbiont]QKQ27528.1 MCP four helix bundle domain-containing protein [Candidatus Reidiella endopervernicosa]